MYTHTQQNVEMISQLEERIENSEMLSQSIVGREDDVLYQDLQHSSSDSDSPSDMDM